MTDTTATTATYVRTADIALDELAAPAAHLGESRLVTCGNSVKLATERAPTVCHHPRGSRPPMRAVTDIAERTCTVPECGKAHKAKGFCSRHYQRWSRHGDVKTDNRSGPRPDSPLPDRKKCNKCRQDKAAADFYTHTDRRGDQPRLRLMAKCKTCHTRVAQDWNERNPERKDAADRAWKKRTRRRYKARLYGLTELELAALEAAQQGQCLICKEFAEGGLVVDHDHSTGHVRGLLCNSCNLGLGAFRDNPKRLLAAILYLKAGSRGVFD